MICPFYHTGDEFWKLFSEESPDSRVTENTYVVTLYNSQFNNEFKEMSEEGILGQPWLVSKIFNKALS